MPAVEVIETTKDTMGQLDRAGVRTYHRTWKVRSLYQNEDSKSITATDLLPRRGDLYFTAHSADLGARLHELAAVRVPNSLFWWDVTATYFTAPGIAFVDQGRSSSDGGGAPTDREIKPWERPAQIAIDSDQATKPAVMEMYDPDDNPLPLPVTNSAGDLFDPPVEADDPKIVLNITKNFISYDTSLIFKYKNAINKDAFFGQPAYTWKVKRFGIQNAFEGVHYYVTVHLSLYHRPFTTEGDPSALGDPGGWRQIAYVDRGYQQIKDGKKVRCVDRYGQPAASPQLLNGSGAQLAITATTDVSNAKYRKFKLYRPMDFSKLLLP